MQKTELATKMDEAGCNEEDPTSSFCGISLLVQSVKRREQKRLHRELGAGG